MLNFIIGLLLGGFIGLFAVALCRASGAADDASEKYWRGKKEEDE